MSHRVMRTVGAIALFLGAGLAAQAQISGGVTRADLQKHDISIAGHEAVQVRVDFAPGAVAPRHRHPGEEVIYVLKGSIEYQIDGQPPVTLDAGGVLFIPDGAIHQAKNVGSERASELATYIVRKGVPISKLAGEP